MNQLSDPISVRFTFRPERAQDFILPHEIQLSDGSQVVSQPYVTQIECEDVEEVMSYVMQFSDALLDCNAIVNGQVVNLSSFVETDENDAV